MKLKNINQFNYKLIKLEIIKSKIISNYLNKFQFETNLTQFEIYLKKAFLIIFQYHINNKKILFIGIPKEISANYIKNLKKTNHIFLPESYWIKGLLTNKLTIFKSIKNSLEIIKQNKLDRIKNYFLLKHKPNLIVLFNTKSPKPILMETVKLKIPVIIFNPNLLTNSTTLYQIKGNYNYIIKKKQNFLLLLIESILKQKI